MLRQMSQKSVRDRFNGKIESVTIEYYKVFDKWKREYISIKNHQDSE